MPISPAQRIALVLLNDRQFDLQFKFIKGHLQPHTFNHGANEAVTRMLLDMEPSEYADWQEAYLPLNVFAALESQSTALRDQALVLTVLPSEAIDDLDKHPENITHWIAFAILVVEIFYLMRSPEARLRLEADLEAEAADAAVLETIAKHAAPGDGTNAE